MKIWVLIPVYNESKNIFSLLQELRLRIRDILVVDDGSQDDTFIVASKLAKIVLRNKTNMGKGISIKRGIEYLLNNEDFEYLILMDGDGQHLPSDLIWFIKGAEKGHRFIIGNRMNNPYGMPFLRLYTNRFMSWLISFLIKQDVPDTQCGFRMIHRDILNKVKITSKRFEIESELIIKSAYLGEKIFSVPIKTVYKKSALSKINPIIDTFRFLKFIINMKKEGYV